MKRKDPPKKPARINESLAIRPGGGMPLSQTQMEFNRLMKSLDTTRARYAREQARVDDALATSIRELMPLVEDLNRTNLDLVINGNKAIQSLKLTAKRRLWLGDLLSGKAADLLADPCFGTLASPVSIKRNLQEELERHREMLQTLTRNDPKSRQLIYEWADKHVLRSSCPF